MVLSCFRRKRCFRTQHRVPCNITDSLLVYVLLSSSQELQNNTLAEKPENITVSPR